MGALGTKVEVCNHALAGLLGKPMLVSLTQAGTEAAKCRLFYPTALEVVARASDWSFLRERAALASITNDRSEGWDRAYDLPSRALKLFYLLDPNRPQQQIKDYQLSSGVVYTNLSPAYAHYVTLEDTTEADWSLQFKLAVAAYLASLLAPSMTRKTSDPEKYLKLYQTHTGLAIEEDANAEFVRYAVDESYVHGNLEQVPFGGNQLDGSTIWGN